MWLTIHPKFGIVSTLGSISEPSHLNPLTVEHHCSFVFRLKLSGLSGLRFVSLVYILLLLNEFQPFFKKKKDSAVPIESLPCNIG
jgi:hypothetical protein